MTGITHPNNAGIGHQTSGIWDMGHGIWDRGPHLGDTRYARRHKIIVSSRDTQQSLLKS